jgi:MFS family permease
VTSIYNVVGPIFNFIFIVFFLDRVGRRKPLLFGTIGISIALVCEAALGSQVNGATGSRKDGISGAGVFFLFLVSCIFSVSFGPISWVYASEIMPLSIRGRGSAFATGVGNWLVGTVWSQVSPIALGEITYKFYFIFVAFNLCVTLPTIWFVFKASWFRHQFSMWLLTFVQETKQLTLEEIDLLFGDRALGMLPDNLGDAEKQIEMERIEDARRKLAGTNVTAVH